jgi:hypothetical protein
MPNRTAAPNDLEAHAFDFYHAALGVVRASGVPFLVGGAYALAHYTGILRHTKDLDLFARPADAPRLLAALERAGYKTEMTFSHWLGKAFAGDDFVDVIFCSGNGACPVDEGWLEHAVPARVMGADVRLCPAEEMIWQKAFIQERERYDGADVLHLLRGCGPRLDWPRLVARFGPHWPILLSHLILFGFVYPADQDRIPANVVRDLAGRLLDPAEEGSERLCRGTLLSRSQYLIDTEQWGYLDARLPPWGRMTPEQITHWTAAIRR